MMIYGHNLQLISHVLIPGSADSEVSEEQKKEKIAELKKKEKDLQDTLTKKLEELKKICMREAVSVFLILLFYNDVLSVRALSWLVVVLTCRSLQADYLKSIPWLQVRGLPKFVAVLGRPSSWMIFSPMMRLV